MRAKRDRLALRILVVRIVKGEQAIHVLARSLVLPDTVEQSHEYRIPLPEYGVQLHHVEPWQGKRLGIEEIRRVIHLTQHIPILTLSHGRQLEQVPEHHHLHAPERLVTTSVMA